MRGETCRCAVLGDRRLAWGNMPCCALDRQERHSSVFASAGDDTSHQSYAHTQSIIALTMTFPNVPSPSTLWISYAFFFWNDDGWGRKESFRDRECILGADGCWRSSERCRYHSKEGANTVRIPRTGSRRLCESVPVRV